MMIYHVPEQELPSRQATVILATDVGQSGNSLVDISQRRRSTTPCLPVGMGPFRVDFATTDHHDPSYPNPSNLPPIDL